jgi:anthranilate synthase/aminodeoxychorismate synthase-like glutamine amidotransferase
MILLIDNYDSFVHNLARYFGRLGRERKVVRNDAITLKEISLDPPEAIILSPGPCTPAEAGICNELVRHYGPRIPILGVCLGHQCIGEVYGGRIVRAPKPVHGSASFIQHNATGLFLGLPNPMLGARYHSLIVDLPANTPLDVTARTEDGIIMAVQHKQYPVYGIQFHPESCLTENGIDILRNFMCVVDKWNGKQKEAA